MEYEVNTSKGPVRFRSVGEPIGEVTAAEALEDRGIDATANPDLVSAVAGNHVYVVVRYGAWGGDDATLGGYAEEADADRVAEAMRAAYGRDDQDYGVELVTIFGPADATTHIEDIQADVAAWREVSSDE